MIQKKKKESLKLFVFAVNPDSVRGFKLCRSKGLSCGDGNIREVSKTMNNYIHYTKFELPIEHSSQSSRFGAYHIHVGGRG